MDFLCEVICYPMCFPQFIVFLFHSSRLVRQGGGISPSGCNHSMSPYQSFPLSFLISASISYSSNVQKVFGNLTKSMTVAAKKKIKQTPDNQENHVEVRIRMNSGTSPELLRPLEVSVIIRFNIVKKPEPHLSLDSFLRRFSRLI